MRGFGRITPMVLATLAAMVCLRLRADEFNDGIDRTDPKFVKASLMVASPGEELFSCVGHCFIRLECPTFKLDNCFSYESEAPSSRLLTFFAGNLRQGLYAKTTADMLKEYEMDGRGVRQYALNLAPAVKQRLWKTMDECAAKNANLPYDYIARGCAKSVLDCLRAAVAPGVIEGRPLTITQRETFNCELSATHPWNLFILNFIVGVETDTFVDVVTPRNLLAYLRAATIGGVPVIVGDGEEVLQRKLVVKPSWFSPLVFACLLLALAAVGFAVKSRMIDWLFLSFQTALGSMLVYLSSASALPTACWNWLLVPFNPLPLVFWRGRRRWALGFAALLVAWEAFMLFSPHAKTDPAYCVIALAYIVFYIKVGLCKSALPSVKTIEE